MDEVKYFCKYTDVVDPKTLTPHPRNPNKHPASQVDALMGNIREYGWRHPIVVSRRSGLIIAGHCRRIAAEKIGCDAPVDYQDFETDDDELAVLLADNVLPELSDWDEELKLGVIEELKMADVDLEIIGISETDEDKDKDDGVLEILIVEVTCKSELEQNEVFTLLKKRGYDCKVMGI